MIIVVYNDSLIVIILVKTARIVVLAVKIYCNMWS